MTGFPSSPFASVRTAPRRSWGRVLRLGIAIVLGLGLLALLTGIGLYQYANSRLERTSIPSLDPEAVETGADGQPLPEALNVLVVGTDSREGLTEQQLLELGTEDIGTDLTDTIMLVQVSPGRDRAVLLSFPRDLRVEVPGEGTERINAVHGLGGADLLVRTVEDYTGVQVDHYVEVNLAGFLSLTDALGGVEVCLDEPMVDRYAGVDLPAGCTELDGADAAGFVRSRRSSVLGTADDFGRIARQQYFVSQAMRKITSAGTLANPLKVKRLIDVVAGAVTTDDGLGASEMYALAGALRDLQAGDVDMRTIPSYYSQDTGYVHAYPERAEALLQSLRHGEPLPDVGQEIPKELEPADVAVGVLNGVGTPGLAAEVADYLAAEGFEVPLVDNAGDYGVARTLIAYAPGEEARGRLVAGFFPGAQLVESDRPLDGVAVLVTVGDDWERP